MVCQGQSETSLLAYELCTKILQVYLFQLEAASTKVNSIRKDRHGMMVVLMNVHVMIPPMADTAATISKILLNSITSVRVRSIAKIIHWHHGACEVIPNGQREGQIFILTQIMDLFLPPHKIPHFYLLK